MESNTINEIFRDNLSSYESSKRQIVYCLQLYEAKVAELIVRIAQCELPDAQAHFDALSEIQSKLAVASFKFEFPMSSRLNAVIREFDRLGDPHIRRYWFERFKEGTDWPTD